MTPVSILGRMLALANYNGKQKSGNSFMEFCVVYDRAEESVGQLWADVYKVVTMCMIHIKDLLWQYLFTSTVVHPYSWFCFLRFHLPAINCGLKILHGKFQK